MDAPGEAAYGLPSRKRMAAGVPVHDRSDQVLPVDNCHSGKSADRSAVISDGYGAFVAGRLSPVDIRGRLESD